MLASTLGLLLADTDAIQFIVYGVILLVTVLGGLLQKKKEEQKSSPPPTPRAPAPQQRPPVRARPPVQRPQREPPPWGEASTLPSRARRPAETGGTLPAPATTRGSRAPAGSAPQSLAVPTPAPQELAVVAARELVRPALSKRARRGASPYSAALLRSLLHKPQSVQTAIVLSEILSPPVALRD